ncbi:MAG TPA: flagellar hook-basal body complex protein FliE [Acidobacteriaceae bacterium]|jgi:flagellar hook-basal body complex protein FliE|nr:flagellar hook-basal body complex protein FliE [Acidobacteriaceae bacterium]
MNTIIPGNLSSTYIPDTTSSAAAGDDLTGGGSFTDVLQSAVGAVNHTNDSAATQVANLLQGHGGDMNSVMIAVEKADVSFQLMMQVRNKIVSAYQDIEKMQF